jgi:hypothetical protein
VIYSQTFHQILYFPLEKNISGKQLFFENVNISENNIISVELETADTRSGNS